MFAAFTQRRQVLVQGFVLGVLGGCRLEATGVAILGAFRRRIVVQLGVMDAHGHVEQLTHGGVAEGTASQLRHIVLGLRLGIEDALVDQLFTEYADQRLGDREHDVAVSGDLAIEVALVHHAPLVQHQEAVGLAGQQMVEGGNAAAARTLERQTFQGHRRIGQHRVGAWAGGDVDGRAQARQVAEAPAIERRRHPVGPGHALFRLGRETLHQYGLLFLLVVHLADFPISGNQGAVEDLVHQTHPGSCPASSRYGKIINPVNFFSQ